MKSIISCALGAVSPAGIALKLAPALLASAFAALSALPAQAVTSTAFVYSATQTGYYSIDAFDMVPNNATTANAYTNYSNSDLSGTDGSAGRCFGTGVHLPQASKIFRLSVYYASTSGIFVTFDRNQPATGASITLAYTNQIPEYSGQRKTRVFNIPATNATVSNGPYTYNLLVCLLGGDHFYGARVDYHYTRAGD